MLKYRLIFGPLLIIAFLAIVCIDDRLDLITLSDYWANIFGRDNLPHGLLLFFSALCVTPLAAKELTKILVANGIDARVWLTTIAAMLGLILSYSIPTKLSEPTDIAMLLAIIPSGLILMFAISLFTFTRNQNVKGVAASAGAVVIAMVYLGLMFGFLLAIRRWHSAWWIVGIIMTTKMCDTGAYFTGRSIGKHKLIPWLSPGKTWEGLIGGLVFAAAFSTALAALSNFLPEPNDHLNWWMGTICGLIFGLVGQLGDLAMSLFKRGAGVKDSSTMIPGLGGVLDVLDSPLMVAPVAYWMLILFA